MVYWDDLGFTTNYEIEPDLEYPGDGNWGLAEVLVGRDGGAGPIARVTRAGEEPWLLAAELDPVYRTALYATPDPDTLCLVRRYGDAVFVRSRSPHTQLSLGVDPIRLAACHEPSLLLIAGYDTVEAFDGHGVRRWRAESVVWDVHILRTDNGRIVCRGFGITGGPDEVTLDARTGERLP